MSNGFVSVNLTGPLLTGNAGANSIFLTRLTPIHNATATAVLINVPSSVAGISFKAVIYDGSHSALLKTGSTVTSLAAGYNRLPLTTDLALTAGTNYYVGYVCANSLNVSIQSFVGTSWFVSGGQSVSSPVNPLSGGTSSSNSLLVALEFSGSNQGYGWGPDGTTGASLTFSNEMATVTATAHQAVRSIVTQSAASATKSYAEVSLFGTIDVTCGIGVWAASIGMALASSTNLFNEVIDPFGDCQGTTAVSGGFTYTTGDTISIAYDSSAQQVWFRLNGGTWFGNGTSPDPATGTSGLAVNPGNWPVMIGAGNNSSGSASQFVLRDTANLMLYSLPSGYSAWSSATADGLALVPISGVAATAHVGGVTIPPKLSMFDLFIAYWPVRTAILFDGTPSGDTDASITGVTATAVAGPVRTQIAYVYSPSPSALTITYAPEDFAKALLDLLPHGRVWPKYPSSNLSQTITALIGSYARAPGSSVGDNASAYGSSNRASNLLLDTMISWNELGAGAIIELLPEWQATLGLPDPCLPEGASIEQQVRQCVARFLALGGQSIAFLTQFCAALGFVITVEEAVGFRPDLSTSDSELRDEWAVFLWQVTSTDDGNWLFETDLNMADETLGGFGNTVLECEIRRVAPAHTVPYFATVANLPLNGVVAIMQVGTLIAS